MDSCSRVKVVLRSSPVARLRLSISAFTRKEPTVKILYPWEKLEPRVLLFRPSSAATAVLRKARPPRSRSSFDRLVDYLATVEGRVRFSRLMHAINNGVRVQRTPRIVGVAR